MLRKHSATDLFRPWLSCGSLHVRIALEHSFSSTLSGINKQSGLSQGESDWGSLAEHDNHI